MTQCIENECGRDEPQEEDFELLKAGEDAAESLGL